MIAIIKACGSNMTSVQFALERVGKQSILTNDKEIIRRASHVIFPGVGHAGPSIKKLQSLGLLHLLTELRQPVLGICLGMQLLYEYSEEGDVDCLGIIPGKIKRLLGNKSQIVPHTGWNHIDFIQNDHFLSYDSTSDQYVYFVHSYAAPLNEYTVAVTEYTEKFTSIVQYKNFIGMQFHPEKSGKFGETLLMNFLQMRSR